MAADFKMTWVNYIFVGSMWNSRLKCNKALIVIDLKWLKSTQNLTGSPLLGKKLPVATNTGKGRFNKIHSYQLLISELVWNEAVTKV